MKVRLQGRKQLGSRLHVGGFGGRIFSIVSRWARKRSGRWR